jgi:hypothetical protein
MNKLILTTFLIIPTNKGHKIKASHPNPTFAGKTLDQQDEKHILHFHLSSHINKLSHI